MKLNRFNVEQKICPVNTLKTYIKITEKLRNGETKVFLSYLRPFRPVGIKTISRWIKTELKSAGINTNTHIPKS